MKTAAILAAILAVGAASASARADGLPVLGLDLGSTGVVTHDGTGRYVTLRTEAGTILVRVSRPDGTVAAYGVIRGDYSIPAVAYDGTAAGVSRDGRTVLLVHPRRTFPQRRTRFALVDTHRFAVRERIALRGDFSFDAMSPDGRWVYLIQYLSARDPNRYAVRLYDTRTERLLRKPIVDPTEPDEKMGGSPITRVSSPDGRWAYTLYDGGGKEPFVHALDTTGRTARCIDLDALGPLAGQDTSQYHLRLRGSTLVVDAGGSPLQLIDLKTFEAREPPAPKLPAAATSPAPDRDGGPAWWIPALTGVALAGIFAIALLRRRPRLAWWRSRSSATPSP